MRRLLRSSGGLTLLLVFAAPLFAEDGATLYGRVCATCHDTGFERAPSREALRAMSPERVLAALESGVMISMTAGRTAIERRAIAEFVTGKSFGRPLLTKPSPQSMCAADIGDFAGPLTGPAWNGWGVNTFNTWHRVLGIRRRAFARLLDDDRRHRVGL